MHHSIPTCHYAHHTNLVLHEALDVERYLPGRQAHLLLDLLALNLQPNACARVAAHIKLVLGLIGDECYSGPGSCTVN